MAVTAEPPAVMVPLLSRHGVELQRQIADRGCSGSIAIV